MLVDIGVNLVNRQFAHDLDAVIDRARKAGVSRMIVTGVSLAGSRQARDLASLWPGTLWSTAGVHPHHARELDRDGVASIREIAARPEVVAIGECGLDFDRNFSPPAAQRRAFEWQLELAAELGLPVFLHERAAHDDFHAIVANARASLAGVVVHCFTGGPREAARYLALDAHLGITGWLCDERRGEALRAAAATIPAERLLVETDAPYLRPRDLPRGERRNEPCHLPHVVRALARLRREPVEALTAETHRNACTLFGL